MSGPLWQWLDLVISLSVISTKVNRFSRLTRIYRCPSGNNFVTESSIRLVLQYDATSAIYNMHISTENLTFGKSLLKFNSHLMVMLSVTGGLGRFSFIDNFVGKCLPSTYNRVSFVLHLNDYKISFIRNLIRHCIAICILYLSECHGNYIWIW